MIKYERYSKSNSIWNVNKEKGSTKIIGNLIQTISVFKKAIIPVNSTEH
jgi:hypothetical protein